MSDIKQLLDRVAGPARNPVPADLAADVARGHRGLRQRRLQFLGGAAVVAIVGAGLAVGGAALRDEPAAVQAERTAAVTNPLHIQFVAYSDPQPEGYSVTTVPDGWQVQYVSAAALVIAPPELLATHPENFEGKLVVMIDNGPLEGDPVAVGEWDGYLRTGEGVGQLRWVDGDGREILVQWPLSAGWSDEEIADFAAGIEVLPGVVAPQG